MTTAEQLIEQNNALRDQLTEANKKYYEDFLLYIRLNSFFIEDLLLEEQLMQILQDTLDAQIDGLSAEEFYGSDPKEKANELLESLPKKPLFQTGIKWFGYCFSVISLYMLINELTNFDSVFSFSRFLATGVVSVCGVFILIFTFSKIIFTKFSTIWQFFIVFLFSIFLIGLFVLIDFSTKSWLSIQLPNSIWISLALLIIFGYTLYLVRKPKKEIQIALSIAPYIYFTCMFSLAYRSDLFPPIFSQKTSQLLLALGSTICWILFIILSYRQSKKTTN